MLWDRLKTIDNLTAVGRTGQFYYNNMALTVCLGQDLARKLLNQPTYWQEQAQKAQAGAAAAAAPAPEPVVADRDH